MVQGDHRARDHRARAPDRPALRQSWFWPRHAYSK